MLDTIGAHELVEWQAFADLEPFGPTIEDIRAGTAAAVFANVHRKKDAPAIGPLHFFPWHSEDFGKPKKPPKRETPDEIARNIRTKVFGLKE